MAASSDYSESQASCLASAVPAELGFLDFELNAKRATTKVAAQLLRLGSDMERTTPHIRASGDAIAAAAGQGVEVRHKVARRAASRIEAHAKRQERLEAPLRLAVDELTQNSLGWIRTTLAKNGWNELEASLQQLAKYATVARGGAAEYRQAVQANRQLMISQDMNRSTERLMEVLEKELEDIDRVNSFCTAGTTLVRQRTAGAVTAAQRSPQRTKRGRSPRPPSRGSEDKG